MQTATVTPSEHRPASLQLQVQETGCATCSTTARVTRPGNPLLPVQAALNSLCLCAVLYLDVDTVVLHSLDPLFDCPGLCGVLRHSEKLNTGVMVATPSAFQAAAIAAAVPELPSYTG